MPRLFKTQITHDLGIIHPVIQGGMGWVGCEIAAAVSNAGGLGMICAGTHAQEGGPEGLRALIQKCKTLTDKPFGVNFLLLNNSVDYMKIAQVVIDENIPCVETAGRPPPPELLKMLKSNNTYIIHKVTAIRHALAAEKAGVDAIEVAGFDLGGHPGEKDVGNWILLTKAGKTLTKPWIAAGGNATGEQLAAALTMGASGINMGTRFMATQECQVGDEIKEAIVNGSENSTELLMRGYNTLRVFKNTAAVEAKKIEIDSGNQIGLAKVNSEYKGLLADNPGANTRKAMQGKMNQDEAVWSAGQAMGLIDDIPTCKELIENIVEEAAIALERGTSLLASSM